ncbi:hypothetical protein E4U46_003170 [Claviceps purpurea]|nr:hypothetical protein E4U49_004344 [Claviceps purpurea]KAG6296094.1 hypothetical protein E4U46_003170 [Claviceps purpurea]
MLTKMDLFSCWHSRTKRYRSSKKREPLYKHEEEQVYPIHCLDQPTTAKQSLRTWVMCFNDVLIAPKLHEALCRLLEIGDWKKLGTRLRVRDDGLLEAYAPKIYSHENPACTFFFDKHYESRIGSHPVGKYYSIPSHRAFTQIYPADYQPDLIHPESPTTVQEIIDRNVPQLILHILAFSDATIVTITTPENMMDYASFKSLLENWSLVLAGRQEEVALVYGPHNDILEELVHKAEEKNAIERIENLRASERFSRFSILPNRWRRRIDPVLQRRIVHVPKAVYEELLSQIRRDITRILENEEQRPIVNDAEILFAWMSQLQGGDATRKTRAVTMRNMFNFRHRLSSLRDPSGEYLQTLTFPLQSTLSAESAKKSIGHIALQHKRDMDRQTSENQLRSLVKSYLQSKKGGRDPFQKMANAGGVSLDYCNMTSLHLLSAADFRPAVLQLVGGGGLDQEKGRNSTRYNAPGTMTTAYVLESGMRRPKDAVCQAIGKDSEGSFWMYCQLEHSVWERLEEELYRLQKVLSSPVLRDSLRFENSKMQ